MKRFFVLLAVLSGVLPSSTLHAQTPLASQGLQITTESLPSATEMAAYSVTLNATSGVLPYTWSATSVGYGEFDSPAEFSEAGVAQGWSGGDDSAWALPLPFGFSFYGNTYTVAYVSSKGTINFDGYFYDYSPSLSEFKQHPMIAPLWADLNTSAGDIYVESTSERVLIRWQGTYWYDSPAVNFAVALYADGTIEFLYGGGNANGGFIGISAGDGVNYVLSELSQSGSVDNANSVLFDYGPFGAAILPPGLALSPAGVLSGVPTEVGVYEITVGVTDAVHDFFFRTFPLDVVQNPNERPVISGTTPMTGLVRLAKGASQAFTVSASDFETSELTYVWTLDGAVVLGNGASYTYIREDYDNRVHVLRCSVQDDLWTDQVFAAWYLEPATTPGTVLGWGASGTGRTTTPRGLTDVVQIAAGMNHNLALKTNGTVVAWGYNGYGQTDVPEGLSDVVSIAAGGINSCGASFAVKADGYIVGWGQSYEVQNYWSETAYWDPYFGWVGGWVTYTNGVDLITIPGDTSGVVALSVGDYHMIALKSNGAVMTWGNEINSNYDYGQYDVPEALANAVAVAAGSYHNLALKSDGTVVAWGANWNGPCDVPEGLSEVVSITAGAYHSMALKSDGTVVAWGANWDGQCDVPPGLTNVISIAAGESHSMAMKTDGSVVVWGDNGYGQCEIPEMVMVDAVYGIAAGGYHCQAIVPDSDGDGTFDWLETDIGRNPNNPADGGQLSAVGGRVFSAVTVIRGAFVELRGASGRVYHQATTDDEGVYAIADVEPGNYFVKVSAEGYADVWYEQAYHRDVAGTLAVPAGTTVSPVDFRLKRGQTRAYATVTSTPSGASIFVDHVSTEQVTPATVDLGQFAASHTVSLGVQLVGYIQPGSITIRPIEGETRGFHFDLEAVGTGSSGVMVVTLPEVNAEVFVDGFDAPLGVTPLFLGNLAAASHTLAYAASHTLAYPASHTLPLAASHTLVLRKAGYLQPAPVVFDVVSGAEMEIAVPVNVMGASSNLTVEVRSTPAGAAVYVDSLPTEEVTDVVIDWLDAASHGVTQPGVGSWHSASHTIMLRKAGYRSSTALPIPFGTGTTNVIEMALLQASDLYPVIRLTGDLDFGEVRGGGSGERQLDIYNDGDASLNIRGIVCPDGFSGYWRGIIPPGGTQDVVIVFEPTEVKGYTGEIVVLSDASIDTGKIGCSGTGLISLPLALDTDGMLWDVGGNTNWFPQALVTHDGVDAAQSGAIGHAHESWMETSVTGPAMLSFWWKVSSEADWDWLEFYIDGALRGYISGEVDWEQQRFNLAEGVHTVRWCYVKDRVDWDPVGEDAAWVDQVVVELDSTPSGIPVNWLGKYGLKTDGSDDDKDADGDGHTTRQEWEADTIPTNRQSVLRFESAPMPLPGSRSLLRWQSVTTRSYHVERATNLVIENPFQPIATGIPGEEGYTEYEDDTGAQPGPFFYRIGVQAP